MAKQFICPPFYTFLGHHKLSRVERGKKKREEDGYEKMKVISVIFSNAFILTPHVL